MGAIVCHREIGLSMDEATLENTITNAGQFDMLSRLELRSRNTFSEVFGFVTADNQSQMQRHVNHAPQKIQELARGLQLCEGQFFHLPSCMMMPQVGAKNTSIPLTVISIMQEREYSSQADFEFLCERCFSLASSANTAKIFETHSTRWLDKVELTSDFQIHGIYRFHELETT
jgi:hypothetical protein